MRSEESPVKATNTISATAISPIPVMGSRSFIRIVVRHSLIRRKHASGFMKVPGDFVGSPKAFEDVQPFFEILDKV